MNLRGAADGVAPHQPNLTAPVSSSSPILIGELDLVFFPPLTFILNRGGPYDSRAERILRVPHQVNITGLGKTHAQYKEKMLLYTARSCCVEQISMRCCGYH